MQTISRLRLRLRIHRKGNAFGRHGSSIRMQVNVVVRGQQYVMAKNGVSVPPPSLETHGLLLV